MKKISILFFALASILFYSCEGDVEPVDSVLIGDTDSSNNNGSNNNNNYTFKADFNGATWNASSASAQVGGDFISIVGLKGTQGESFAFLVEANTPGTYPANVNILAYTPANDEYGYWSLNVDNPDENTGSITITNIDTTNRTISGTFQFKGYWTDSDVTNIAPIQFTNGVFTNVPYTDYTDDGADTFYAKVNGVEFVDTDILAVTVNEFIGIGAKNDEFESISVGINESLVEGTYTITGNISTDVVQATYSLDDTTSYTATSGTVTITSKTADRIVGTFSFTTSGGGVTYTITEGQFDVSY